MREKERESKEEKKKARKEAKSFFLILIFLDQKMEYRGQSCMGRNNWGQRDRGQIDQGTN
jgi:hypothetical protein